VELNDSYSYSGGRGTNIETSAHRFREYSVRTHRPSEKEEVSYPARSVALSNLPHIFNNRRAFEISETEHRTCLASF
jgi:hypothetical protein